MLPRTLLLSLLLAVTGLTGYWIGRSRVPCAEPPPAEASAAHTEPRSAPETQSRARRVPDLPPARPDNPLQVLPLPGLSAADVYDTFGDRRGSGTRAHEALDLMTPRGTPVLAVADGTVRKLFDSKQGGLTIYHYNPAGKYIFYYAHLDRYAAGLVEGQAVRAGEVIGYAGSSGNAQPDAPHLHFAILKPGPEGEWWRGTVPVNPYPWLLDLLKRSQ